MKRKRKKKHKTIKSGLAVSGPLVYINFKSYPLGNVASQSRAVTDLSGGGGTTPVGSLVPWYASTYKEKKRRKGVNFVTD